MNTIQVIRCNQEAKTCITAGLTPRLKDVGRRAPKNSDISTEDLEAVVGGRTVFVVGYRLIRWTIEDRHQRAAEKRTRRNYKQQAAPFSSASAVFGCSGAIIPE